MGMGSETNTNHWAKATETEVKTVLPALQVKEDRDHSFPVGSQYIDLMTVFDVKMDITHKARIVAQGNQTKAPASIVTHERT